jgi:UDP-glucuronate decarboxylase
LIEGLIALMRSPDEITGPINLGNPVEFTMAELAQMLIAMTGSKSSLMHIDLPPDDPRQRQPDITKARTLLKWEPRISLEEGLRSTIAYFQGSRSASQN